MINITERNDRSEIEDILIEVTGRVAFPKIFIHSTFCENDARELKRRLYYAGELKVRYPLDCL